MSKREREHTMNKTDYSINNPAIRMEQLLIQHLTSLGFDATPSTKRENIVLDIDCWLLDDTDYSEATSYAPPTPVSIKYQPTAAGTGNICVELSVKLSAAATQKRSNRKQPKLKRRYLPSSSSRWLPSWGSPTGGSAATHYLIHTGDRLLWIEKNEEWDDLVDGCWNAYYPTRYRKVAERNSLPHGCRITRLSHRVRLKQVESGHPHIDAENLLIPVSYLLEAGLAIELPLPG